MKMNNNNKVLMAGMFMYFIFAVLYSFGIPAIFSFIWAALICLSFI